MQKAWAFYLVGSLALSATVWCADPGNPASPLPESIRATLDQEYPGWKLAPVTPLIQKAYKQQKTTHAPSLTAADFDGDGKRDYAVQIVLNTPGEEEQIIIAFLARGDHFEESILQSMGIDPHYSLWVLRTALDETGAHPENPVTKNVLMVLGGPIGDTVYSYDDGKFHEITSPEDSEHPDSTIPRVAPPPDPAPEKMEP